MEKKEFIYSLDEIDQAVDLLKDQMDECAIFTFSGPLGAGKTTLIQKFLQACGVHAQITSPTFTYVNVYRNKPGTKFYHFDLYRIESVDTFLEQGFDEYLYQPKSWAVIEWPEVIKSLLPDRVCEVSIDYHNDKRKLVINYPTKK